MLTKVRNYDVLLVQYAKSIVGNGFAWGQTDCVSIVRECLRIQYGKEVFRGLHNWSSLREAVELFNTIDVDDQLAHWDGHRVGRNYVTCGDVGVSPTLDEENLPRFSLVLPVNKILISTPQTGVVIHPMTNLEEGTNFWRFDE